MHPAARPLLLHLSTLAAVIASATTNEMEEEKMAQKYSKAYRARIMTAEATAAPPLGAHVDYEARAGNA